MYSKYIKSHLVAISVVTLGISAPTDSSSAKELTMSVWVPRTHAINTKMLTPWAAQVKEATSGRVSIRTLPKKVAGSKQHFNAIRDGLADVTFIVHGYTPGRFVLTKGVELPFLADDGVSLSVAYWRMHNRMLAAKDEHKGVKLLSLFTQGPGAIFSATKPIDTPASLKGMKIRVGGAARDVTKAIGAVPVSKPVSQLYELMSKGVTDGVIVPKETVVSFKIDKVIKWGVIVPGGVYRAGFALIMNNGKFDGLSATDRQAVSKVSGEAFARLSGLAWDAADSYGEKKMREAGIKLSTASPAMTAAIKQRTSGMEGAWIASAKKKGIDGAAFLAALRAEVKKVAGGS